jgi:hypothetical protein
MAILHDMDGGAAPVPAGFTLRTTWNADAAPYVPTLQPQLLSELSPTMTYTYDAAHGSMPNEMQYLPPVDYSYHMNVYHTSSASNQHAMRQSGMSGFQENPSTLHHPPTCDGNAKGSQSQNGKGKGKGKGCHGNGKTNHRHLPKGRGSEGQPPKGNVHGGKRK